MTVREGFLEKAIATFERYGERDMYDDWVQHSFAGELFTYAEELEAALIEANAKIAELQGQKTK